VRTIALFLGVLLILAGPASAQTGNEEGICRPGNPLFDPNTFFCENWQDVPAHTFITNPPEQIPQRFKTGVWTATGGAIVNLLGPTGSTQHVLEFQYPAIFTGKSEGGAGSLDTAINGTWNEYYLRWYAKWVNYKWSTISTKHLETGQACGNGASEIFEFSSQFDNNGQSPPGAFPQSFTQPRFQVSCSNSPNGFNNLWLQNVGSAVTITSVAGFANNPWVCLESHVKHSTGGVANGIIEGWMQVVGTDPSPVKKFNYPATQTNLFTGGANSLLIATTWNCFSAPCNTANNSDQAPVMWRYTANIVMSTARIGCIGSVGPPPPNAPTNLHKTQSPIPLGVVLVGDRLVRR
jgi:hypothetical protein